MCFRMMFSFFLVVFAYSLSTTAMENAGATDEPATKSNLSVSDFSDDVLEVIVKSCGLKELGRLAQTTRSLKEQCTKELSNLRGIIAKDLGIAIEEPTQDQWPQLIARFYAFHDADAKFLGFPSPHDWPSNKFAELLQALGNELNNLDNVHNRALISSWSTYFQPLILSRNMAGDSHYLLPLIALPQKDMPLDLSEAQQWFGKIKEYLRACAKERNSYGKTLLMEAAAGGHQEVLHLLMSASGQSVNWHDQKGKTALIYAVINGRAEIVRILLAVPQIDVYVRGRFNRIESSALIEAVNSGHIEIVRILLSLPGLDVNVRDKMGRTALVAAMVGFKDDIADLLLDDPRVDINLGDNLGATALGCALGSRRYELASKLFTRSDLNVNSLNYKGESEIFDRARSAKDWRDGYRALNMLLADPRIDLTIRNREGKTVMDVAHKDALPLLERKMSELGAASGAALPLRPNDK